MKDRISKVSIKHSIFKMLYTYYFSSTRESDQI